MPQYRAAILHGPRGPFAVVELSPDQHQRLTGDARAALTGCVRQHHGAVPVVFVTAGASTLHALDGQDVTAETQQCLSDHCSTRLSWADIHHVGA